VRLVAEVAAAPLKYTVSEVTVSEPVFCTVIERSPPVRLTPVIWSAFLT
jgi:hypothetical protein